MSSKLFEDLLRITIRTFYDEVAVVVVEYILFYGNIEEHKMSEDLNLPFKQVRQALLELNQHQILTYKEGKKDRRHEERSGNMFTRGPDLGRMVYWTFDPDIKNVLCTRIYKLRKALDDLVEEANKVVYYCPGCKRIFTIEEALPNFTCNNCPNSALLRRESSLVEAKEKRLKGVQEIKHMESLMRECLDVTLPSTFFGAVPESNDVPGDRNQNFRLVRPTGSNRGYIVNVNLPEIELEAKEIISASAEHDTELLKYYQKFDRRSQRKKKVENHEKHSEFKDVPANLQIKMSPEEFHKYYEWKTNSFFFL